MAFIEAFRRRGIYPDEIKNLSEESLRYRQDWDELSENYTQPLLGIITDHLRLYHQEMLYVTGRKKMFEKTQKFVNGSYKGKDNMNLYDSLWSKLRNSYEFERLTGLVFNKNWKRYGAKGEKRPDFEILNLRLVSRVGPDGDQINQIIFSMIQSINVRCEEGEFQEIYLDSDNADPVDDCFELFGGCTLIFDLDEVKLKYAIAKPLLNPDLLAKRSYRKRRVNVKRVEDQYRYETEEFPLYVSQASQYFGAGLRSKLMEPFALLHSG